MITKKDKKLAQWTMNYALKNGCQAVRITVFNGSSNSIEVRDMKIDRLQQASEYSLMIRLYVNGRYGSYSTNRFEKNELKKTIIEWIQATGFLCPDEARTLPDASLYYKGNNEDLCLFDETYEKIDPDKRIEIAMNVCDEMMGKDTRLISANSSYSDDQVFKYMITSNGFEGEASETSFGISASANIRGLGESRPEAFWYDSKVFLKDLETKGIGLEALKRAQQKIGQRKAVSGQYHMLVDNMNSARLLSPIINALYGSSIQQKNSFLMNCIDKKILSDKVRLRDTPHLPKAFGSRYFDGEGIATHDRDIFEEGILKTYFIDTYSSNKLTIPPTISGPSVLSVDKGTRPLNTILTDLDKGILVTGFNGGNCNSTSGDFSYGVEGFLIEKGELSHPISEMNITGNILNLFKNVQEIGNDPKDSSSWKIPSLLFDKVNFSGL